jgi:hypothetical protein
VKYLTLITFLLLFTLVQFSYGQSESDPTNGIDLYRKGEFLEASKLLSKLVSDGSADTRTVMYLAGAYVHLKRDQDAKELLNRIDQFKQSQPTQEYDRRLKMIRKPLPEFGRNESSGKVKLLVECKSDGRIGIVFVYALTSPGLRHAALVAAESIQFEPATIAGKPVTGLIFIEYELYR